ncbi:hypothetical protein L204_106062 [Cryptococcus depauperatus]
MLYKALAAAEDESCLSACSHWSITLGFCRSHFSDFNQQFNSSYMNDFVSCLCQGSNKDGTFGNETINQSAGICSTCPTTPPLIKRNLQDFMKLCAVQGANGTSSNATEFRPVGYETSNDASKNVVNAGFETFSRTTGIWFSAILSVFVLGVSLH